MAATSFGLVVTRVPSRAREPREEPGHPLVQRQIQLQTMPPPKQQQHVSEQVLGRAVKAQGGR